MSTQLNKMTDKLFILHLKDEKLTRKQTHMKTVTCKLYSRVFWIFVPYFIKIDPYNFELYRFKVGAFFETQCIRGLTVCAKAMYLKTHVNDLEIFIVLRMTTIT